MGKAKGATNFGRDTEQSNDVRGTLTHRTTTDPYRASKVSTVPGAGSRGGNSGNTAYTRGRGLAVGTQQWVQDKIAEGDIDGGMSSGQTGTSIFDPVLCELIYRWFCPPAGRILDPFAGGSVRGIVASHLGRAYTGVDLSGKQLAANRMQLTIAKDPKPVWVEGDSRDLATLLPKGDQFDLVFSCPPYWNLEVYSEDARDLSTLDAEDFFVAQAAIIRAACARLKNNRFAAWVVGDVRDAKGLYVNLPGRSVMAFEAAGLRLYNEAILITAAGSLAMRTGKQFEASRKLGKSHQNVLVFVKGDPVKATQAIGAVDFGDLEPEPESESTPAGADAMRMPPAMTSPAPKPSSKSAKPTGDPADLSSYGEIL